MKKKKIYFGTNLKMYKGNKATIEYLTELSKLTQNLDANLEIELFVIPSYTTLKDAKQIVKQQKSKIKIGAQNMNPHDEGQFTGEISPLMLKELELDLVMIGHSERRHIMKETDEEENMKVLAALHHGFIALLCIGETLEQKNDGLSDEILRTQLRIGLNGVKQERLSQIWIAYEPVWAIGQNGIPATADYAEAKHQVIKQSLVELFGESGLDIPVLYGGSVNPSNSNELIVKANIDGLFVGRSAWNASEFYPLITNAIHKVENKSI